MSNITPVFAAMCTCGGWVAVAVEDPKYIYDNAKYVASWIRAGYRIEKRTVEDFRTGRVKMCECDHRTVKRQKELFK